jgi:hypothetical protein
MAVIKLTDDEFESFEETIASSAKGRAFLREHSRRNRIMATDDVKRIIYRIRDEMGTGENTGAVNRLEVLRAELQEMAASIVETKRQISALQPKDTGKNRILAATGELDAIVSATERATSEIIAQAESLLSTAEDVRTASQNALAGRIEAAATEILMACSFQDITGQRTNKVVNTMRYLEHRINAMVSIWGGEGLVNVDPAEDDADFDRDSRPDSHLLNGPARDGEGVEQNDIDALFASDDVMPDMVAEPKSKAASAKKPSPEPAPEPKKSAAKKTKDPDPAPEPAAPGAAMAQDDIDSLFS